MLAFVQRSWIFVALGLAGGWLIGASSKREMAGPVDPFKIAGNSIVMGASRGEGAWLSDSKLDIYEAERRLRAELTTATPADCASLFHALMRLPDTGERGERLELLLDQWVQVAPEEALRAIGGSLDLVGVLFEGWARHDVEGTIGRLTSLPKEAQGAASIGAYKTLVDTAPQRALEFRDSWTANHLDGTHTAKAYENLTLEDASAALAFYNQEDQERLVSHGRHYARAIAKGWASHSPDDARAFARSLGGDDKRWALRGVLDTWRPNDLEALGKLVQEINVMPGNHHDRHYDDTGRRVAMDIAQSHDAETAIAWAERYVPDVQRRYFYQDAVQDALGQGADAAVAWLGAIDEPEMRRNVLQNVIYQGKHPSSHLNVLSDVLETRPVLEWPALLEDLSRVTARYVPKP